MTPGIAGLYGFLRGLLGQGRFKRRPAPPAEREARRFPENLWKLDESYRNLLRELSKR